MGGAPSRQYQIGGTVSPGETLELKYGAAT
jgi:hypothetical protein